MVDILVSIVLAAVIILAFPFVFMMAIGLMWMTAIIGTTVVGLILAAPFWAIRKFRRYWNRQRTTPK